MATNTPSYPGFDAFNRVTDIPWTKTTSGDIAHLKYGYDLASNRTHRQDAKASSAHLNEVYTYDGMQRLQSFARGTSTLGTIVTSPKLQQCWDLDATGNWSTYTNSDYGTPLNSLVQRRTSNSANEIVDLEQSVGAFWNPPVYDRNGNALEFPQAVAPTQDGEAHYDAWNRLATLSYDLVSENYRFVYDGLNRRTNTNIYDGGGTLLDVRMYFYSDQWQVLEERLKSAYSVADRQFVWGLRYIDDLVLRDRSVSGTLDERYYNLADANWNTVALVDSSSSANVVQRFNYTPYGVPTFLDASFVASTNTKDWETLYCGYRYEVATGLTNARERWLHALLGCWLALDRLDYKAGDLKRLRYLFNNPLSWTDPFGLDCFAKGKCTLQYATPVKKSNPRYIDNTPTFTCPGSTDPKKPDFQRIDVWRLDISSGFNPNHLRLEVFCVRCVPDATSPCQGDCVPDKTNVKKRLPIYSSDATKIIRYEDYEDQEPVCKCLDRA
jgi:RHS repeat-associated protein